MQQAVARLAGDGAGCPPHWQARLGGLAEALIARSIEASAFDFPIEHFFWGPFNQAQNRDIAAGLVVARLPVRRLRRLGRRPPAQPARPVARGRLRRPGPDARSGAGRPRPRCATCSRDVRVAADEYVAGAAGGLTLGELVTLLGRRADGLTELWNEWGTVRPILLEARLIPGRQASTAVGSARRGRRRAVASARPGSGPSSSSSSITIRRSASPAGDADRLALLGGPGPDPLRRASPARGSGWRARPGPRSCGRAWS